MKKKIAAVAFIILILFIIFNFDNAVGILSKIGKAVYPVFIGIIIALTLNSPVKFLERTILSSPKLKNIKRFIAISITLIAVAGVLAGIYFLISPEISRSMGALMEKLKNINAESLKEYALSNPILLKIADNLGGIIDGAAEKLTGILPAAVDFMANTVKLIVNVFLGLILGCFIIINKEKLGAQLYNLIRYFSDENKSKKILAAISLAGDKFSKFLSGQLLEAVIFGGICYAVFAIFKIPYAALAALVLAIGNLIPILGAYIAGAVAFIFIFTVSTEKALVFLVIILILQQVEQVTTYPIIVGKYVGISSFWILFAVTVGGGLFGYWGLMLSVPFVAFVDNFFKVVFDRKMKKERTVKADSTNSV